jgi:hypothetical protein
MVGGLLEDIPDPSVDRFGGDPPMVDWEYFWRQLELARDRPLDQVVIEFDSRRQLPVRGREPTELWEFPEPERGRVLRVSVPPAL